MKSSDINNINKLYNEAASWQDEMEPMPTVAPSKDKTIVIIDPNDEIIGKYRGRWSKQSFNRIPSQERMGVEFDDWGEPYVQGKGWTLYAYDGVGAVVIDDGIDVNRAVDKAIHASFNAAP